MSILIKGMEMPSSCGKCKFFAWKRGVGQHCAVNDRITFHATIDGMDVAYERNGNCPLIELPKHGRLIDIDDTDSIVVDIRIVNGVGMAVSLAAPTIIEAEDDDGDTDS